MVIHDIEFQQIFREWKCYFRKLGKKQTNREGQYERLWTVIAISLQGPLDQYPHIYVHVPVLVLDYGPVQLILLGNSNWNLGKKNRTLEGHGWGRESDWPAPRKFCAYLCSAHPKISISESFDRCFLSQTCSNLETCHWKHLQTFVRLKNYHDYHSKAKIVSTYQRLSMFYQCSSDMINVYQHPLTFINVHQPWNHVI